MDAHTVEAVERNGTKHTLTAERVVIAVGGRPKYLGVPGERSGGVRKGPGRGPGGTARRWEGGLGSRQRERGAEEIV